MFSLPALTRKKWNNSQLKAAAFLCFKARTLPGRFAFLRLMLAFQIDTSPARATHVADFRRKIEQRPFVRAGLPERSAILAPRRPDKPSFS